MNPRTLSLAISSQKRMHLEQSTQRSSSKVTLGPKRVRFGLTFFSSINRLCPRPCLDENSCKVHSPAWSQIGQSSGWLISRNSVIASRDSKALGESVLICMPGAAFVPQAIAGPGIHIIFGEPSSLSMGSPVARLRPGIPNSTKHMRQFPAIESLG